MQDPQLGLGVETSLCRYPARYVSNDGCYCYCCLIFHLFHAVTSYIFDISLMIEAALEAAAALMLLWRP